MKKTTIVSSFKHLVGNKKEENKEIDSENNNLVEGFIKKTGIYDEINAKDYIQMGYIEKEEIFWEAEDDETGNILEETNEVKQRDFSIKNQYR